MLSSFATGNGRGCAIRRGWGLFLLVFGVWSTVWRRKKSSYPWWRSFGLRNWSPWLMFGERWSWYQICSRSSSQRFYRWREWVSRAYHWAWAGRIGLGSMNSPVPWRVLHWFRPRFSDKRTICWTLHDFDLSCSSTAGSATHIPCFIAPAMTVFLSLRNKWTPIRLQFGQALFVLLTPSRSV